MAIRSSRIGHEVFPGTQHWTSVSVPVARSFARTKSKSRSWTRATDHGTVLP